jgi:UDP-GlcNAc:undecaprenyl-phosphate GlcNAc-1-phosphate transferase
MDILTPYLLLGGVAAALALLVTPVVRALALPLGALDEPSERRVHRGQIPRLGGLAVIAAISGSLLLGWAAGIPIDFLTADDGRLMWLFAGTLTVAAAGMADDIWTLAPVPKLALQIAAASAVVAGGLGFDAVTDPFGGGAISLGPIAPLLSVVWVVGVTNAFNLVDGLDGLAAGVGLIASLTLIAVCWTQGRPDVALLAATLAGALLGFLWYNFYPASIFLGDSGSLVLGFFLAVLSIQARGKGTTAVVVLVPFLVLGLPIMDTLLAVVRRSSLSGIRSVLRADQEHIHHRLLRTGLDQRSAVLVLYGVSTAFGALALLAATLTGPGTAILIGGIALTALLAFRRLGRYSPTRILNEGGPPQDPSVREPPR